MKRYALYIITAASLILSCADPKPEPFVCEGKTYIHGTMDLCVQYPILDDYNFYSYTYYVDGKKQGRIALQDSTDMDEVAQIILRQLK